MLSQIPYAAFGIEQGYAPPGRLFAGIESGHDQKVRPGPAMKSEPKRAAQLAAAQRSAAQVVVTGHVHFPGVWRRAGGPVVINTGSFFRPLGGSLVDVFGDRVEVRRIVRTGGSFGSGALLATIPLRES